MFDYLFSGRVQLDFPVIASLCIDLTHDAEYVVGLPRAKRMPIKSRRRFVPAGGFFTSGGETSMVAGKAQPEAKLLSAFALAIFGALAAALPMALVIIWVCS